MLGIGSRFKMRGNGGYGINMQIPSSEEVIKAAGLGDRFASG